MSAVLPSHAEVEEARAALRDVLPPTRCVEAPSLSAAAGRPVFLKMETDLPTGSFKVRGALWALLRRTREDAVREVVASSTGNHGAAVAWAARRLGLPARIFLPRDPNPVKRDKIAALGAAIVETGDDLTAAFQAALAHAERAGSFFLNDATDPHVPAGPATIACEVAEQITEADVVYAPMGDTALIRGLAFDLKHHRPGAAAIGVQAEGAPAYVLSWRSGAATPTDRCDTLAEGLATRSPVPENVAAIRRLVDGVRLVPDRALLRAVRHLLLEEHVVAEPSGAAATAALLQDAAAGSLPPGHALVLLVTGANVPAVVLRDALDSGA